MEELVWVEESAHWRLLPSHRSQARCRFFGCRAQAVVELQRGSKKKSWWAYCADHLYGRKIENGKIMCAVHPESPAAERGRIE